MAKYKPYDYSQKVMIPVSLEDQLAPGTLEFAIHTLVEERLDLSVFDETYKNDETGRLAYDPKVLLKIILFGYSRGLISSRAIERACRENVTFMALSGGHCPDHSTIAAFVSCMKEEILPLFRNVLLVCDEMGLLGGTFFALDGCKLPSNASKEWSGSVSALKRKQRKLEDKVVELLKEQVEKDAEGGDGGKRKASGEQLDRTEQIEQLRRKADRIAGWLKENEAKRGAKGKEIQSNITDNESAKMYTSHGTVQGYNGQALVDSKHQVIVHAHAFGNGQDHGHVPPMLDGAKESIKKIGRGADYFEGKVFTADTNYHSAANMKKLQEEGLDAYIPDRRFRTRDQRFSTQPRWRQKKKQFRLEDFRYREEADQYVCPGGKNLTLEVKKCVSDNTAYRRYAASERDCRECGLRSECLRGKNPKRRYLHVPLGAEGVNYSKEMVKKIESEKGRKIYPQRLAIVEPVFANIRIHKRLDHFTLRGKVKVGIQWLLFCMVHNIEKILNYGAV